MRRLYRSNVYRKVAGVCGGLAQYMNVDPVVIRLLVAIAIFCMGVGVFAYILAWIIIPRNPDMYA